MDRQPVKAIQPRTDAALYVRGNRYGPQRGTVEMSVTGLGALAVAIPPATDEAVP